MTEPDEQQEPFFKLIEDPEARANPYPVYEEMRSLGGSYRTPIGIWLVTSYARCVSLLKHPKLVRKHGDSWELRGQLLGGSGRRWFNEQATSMLWLDPPDHTRIRSLVSKAFTPRYLSGLRGRIEGLVDDLLNGIEARDEADIISDLALPLPMQVICEMLGVPMEDRDDFRKWTVALAATLEPFPSDRVQDAADEASLAFERYFTDLIARRREDPGDDLLSRLIEVEQSGDGLTEKEVRHTAALVLGAGFETTTNLIGNGTLALLKHRDQWEALVAEPSLATRAVEELLRYDSPVQMATPRVASEDVDTEEGTIQEDDTVVCVVGAANRDPLRHDDPTALDITRSEPAPLSFGGGPHFCLGAALARMEGAVVFREMAKRLPTLTLKDESPPWRETLNIRGLETLPVKVA